MFCKNEEREKIHPYLLKYHKLLFSVFPSEGEQSLINVIQISRIPAHYINIIFTYFNHQFHFPFAIVYNSTNSQSKTISNTFINFCRRFESIGCKLFDVKSKAEIELFVTTTVGKIYENGVVIISILKDKSEILLKQLKDNKFANDKYPVVIIDIIITFAYDSKTPEIYTGHYFITSIVDKYNTLINNQLNSYIDLKYGNKKYLSTEVLVNIDTAMRFLSEGIISSQSTEADTLRNNIHRQSVDVPLSDDKVTMSSDNIANNVILLCKYNDENDYDIILNPYSMLDVYIYSQYVFIIYNYFRIMKMKFNMKLIIQ